jgi:hypothetical protein
MGPTDLSLVPYINIYPKTNRDEHEETFLPPQASVFGDFHLEPVFGILPEGGSTLEGFCINLAVLPMMCEYFTTDL